MHTKHAEIFKQYSAGFDAQTIMRWEAAIKKWERNPAEGPDPFEEPVTGA